ncbi:MAG: peptidylprolyl isomerase [Magnetococcales bacterium]|nr:peptidylprolyl isomerase [Magnetococcales bacterium]MBF0151806.1 peptidylprolyl isomerase [Magnetococcales bacterium]MBF0172459.1 peptidylprolyl isomerase [Magnetococcales bacterium]MBF0632762.1 peptidylprolyl isomerase [Magnetococcales bacterium]
MPLILGLGLCVGPASAQTPETRAKETKPAKSTVLRAGSPGKSSVPKAVRPRETSDKLIPQEGLDLPRLNEAKSINSAMQGGLDRIVAIVEAQIISDQPVQPQIITQSEVDELIEPAVAKLRSKGEEFDLEALRKRGLDELIIRKLRDQKAAQLGVTVVDADIDEIIGQVERKNKLPAGGLPDALRREGIDFDRYRKQLSDQVLESRLMKRVIYPLIAVTDEEMRILFDQMAKDQTQEEEIHLGQILLELPAGASSDEVDRLREKAINLVGSLREGKSLASLASQYSSDSSGLSGGDMGWFKKGDLPEHLENVVFHMEKDQVSDPLRSPQGFHIFKMIERRTKDVAQEGQTASYRFKARHILIKVDANRSEEAALARIKEIEEKIKDGTPFEELATKASEDANSAKEGGNLGWFEQGAMVEPFDAAVKELSKGKISAPVRTPFGWHLIKLEDKESLSPNSFEAQKPVLEQRLLATKAKDRYKQWLRDLRLRAFVEYP